MNLDGVRGDERRGWCLWCSHGQNTTLAAECCMWRDGNIEYPATRSLPEFNIAEKEKKKKIHTHTHAHAHTHTHTRTHTQTHTPISELLAVKYHRAKKKKKKKKKEKNRHSNEMRLFLHGL